MAGLMVGAAVLVGAAVVGYVRLAGGTRAAPMNPAAAAAYVGGAACAGCHAAETAAWGGSHHARAMQDAADGTVLGDFNDARFAYDGITSRFFRRDGKFFVNTDGPDGRMADFQVAYTFGVDPLQQYLIAFPDGRLQALSIAWDARPKEAGGQRWFHLHPDEAIRHDDILHWTGINQNWNFMCAECHSTDVRKNYDAAGNRFHTTWSDISVSCEACHGPGSQHVAWAQDQRRWWHFGGAADPRKGLAVAFHERAGATWSLDPASGQPQRSVLQPLRTELETCGRCHSRRAELSESWLPGRSLSDTHLVSLLDRGLYRADGQIEDEVYEYGSFRQSKMFARGVTCSDCHDPHSAALRAPGDGLCVQCHAADKYATARHSFHQAASPPACTACHMPARTYMGVDVRHDHSFRVPRPDLAATLGTPNACNGCHTDKSAEWAATAIERRYGPAREGFQTFGPALHAARGELPEGRDLLAQVVADPQTPGIARATAYAEMTPYLTPDLVPALRRGLADSDPLIRLGALRGFDGVGADRRWAVAGPLLSDPSRAVRVAATAYLAPVPPDRLSPEDRRRSERAAQEYVEVQRFNADRPEARVTLGAFFAQRGEAAEAEAEYRAALKLEPRFVQAYVNLADLDRSRGRDKDGEAVLRQALAVAPDDAAATHAMGLLLARQHRLPEATQMLARAAALDPQRARYTYVYAIALSSAGQKDEALRLLAESHTRHPADRDILAALVSLNRDAGDHGAALRYAEELARLVPGDEALSHLIDELRQAARP
ncbi:MAG TPA: cytochrome c3 family protein [Stellaceae bacterium]|nr:cytochrome c3 family protein [Stellaceae bacterium]